VEALGLVWKGGELPFAAICTSDRSADQADIDLFTFADAASFCARGKQFAATQYKLPKRSLPSGLRRLNKTEILQIMLIPNAKEVVTCTSGVSVYLELMEHCFSVRISLALRQLMLLCVMFLMLMPQIVSAGSSHSNMLLTVGQQNCAEMHNEAGKAQDASGEHHDHAQSGGHEMMDASTCSGMLCSGVAADQTAPVVQMQQLLISTGLPFEIMQTPSVSLDTLRKPPKAA